MNELIQTLIIFGFSLIGGYMLGYGLRKIIKILMFIGGAFIFSLVVLQGLGYIEPNYDKMVNDAETFAENANLTAAQEFASEFNPIVLVGLLIGTVIGFWKAGPQKQQVLVK